MLNLSDPLVKITPYRVRRVLSQAKEDEMRGLMNLPGLEDDPLYGMQEEFDRIMKKYADLHL